MTGPMTLGAYGKSCTQFSESLTYKRVLTCESFCRDRIPARAHCDRMKQEVFDIIRKLGRAAPFTKMTRACLQLWTIDEDDKNKMT